MIEDSSSPTFFASPEEFRAWLAKNYDGSTSLWVGLHKKATGIPSITWPDSIEEALCFGWIDGIRKKHTKGTYKIRFTPRRKNSIWSKKNIESVERLIKEARMQPAGLEAFKARKADKSGIYSFEQEKPSELSAAHKMEFKANKSAWDFFQAQPPGYRKTITHWIMSAKRADTQRKRLDRVVYVSSRKKRVDLLSPYGKEKKK